MNKIIYVDDEPGRVEDYLDFIESSYPHGTLHFFEDLQTAEDYCNEKFEDIKLIIVDIMFGGHENNDYTGMEAGFNFYKKLKNIYPAIKFIILTNKGKENNKEFVNQIEKNKDYFREKISTNPTQLLMLVDGIFKNLKNQYGYAK